TFRLGDRVRVAVARVDTDRRELNFRLVGRGRRPKAGMRDRHSQSRGKVRSAHPKQKLKRQPKGKPSKRRRGR
ncbi:MAG: hypothetical protein ACK6CT_14975, partial [Planctomycetia bacterium]